MCAVSQIGDQFHNNWNEQFRMAGGISELLQSISRSEFEELRKEVVAMKALLLEAKQKDIANKEPDCSHEHKVDLLKKMAEAFGISLDDIFGDANK